MRLGLGLIVCAAAVATLPAMPVAVADPGQNAPQVQQPIRVDVNVVNLFATVRDRKTRRILNDLEQSEFRVFEDGTEQKISYFARETSLPITLGLLIDTSGSELQTLAAEQEAASRFLSRVMRPRDLAMVISFDTDADLLANFTGDLDVLDRAIRRARINAPMAVGATGSSGPGTILYDAIYLACREKLAEEAGRKALVILTDAQDTGSHYRLEDAIAAAQRTDTVVHVLLIGHYGFGGINKGVADKLTEETGGRTIVVRDGRGLEEAFDQISEELRSQYTLGYTPSNPARDGRYRKIKVETTRRDTTVLTRRGYYAPSE